MLLVPDVLDDADANVTFAIEVLKGNDSVDDTLIRQSLAPAGIAHDEGR
jgi:hypothetical protein